MKQQISKTTWQSLMSLALQFKALQPWTWMAETDVFGFRHPKTGAIYYSSIKGNEAEIIGITVHEGTKGLDMLLHMHAEGADPSFETMMEQSFLLFILENKEDLSEEDEALYKMLGVTFKGKNAFPVFNDYSPGLAPWLIQTEAQAEILYYALEQAIEVAQIAQKKPEYLVDLSEEGVDEPKFLVRIPEAKGGDEYAWSETWVVPEDYEDEDENPIEVDAQFLKSKLSDIPMQKGTNWFFDLSYIPLPVQDVEGVRPFFPFLLLVIDEQSGMALGNEIYQLGQPEKKLQKDLARICEENDIRPEKIVIASESVRPYIEPFQEFLGSEIVVDEDIEEYLDEIKEGMFEEMN